MENNIVINESKGHGYNYASLADIASQGYKIPKMKTSTDADGCEYVYWFDETLKEWVRGARIVAIESKMMNPAQCYGASLTYARRYTCHLALSLACDEDSNVENTNADGTPKEEKKASEKQVNYLLTLIDGQTEMKLKEKLGIASLSDLTANQASEYIKYFKEKSK